MCINTWNKMYGGQTIVIFLCYINDYRILSAPPVHGVQKQVSSSFDQKEWFRVKKQMRERAQQLWDQVERQSEGPGTQGTADVIKPRASTQTKAKQALRAIYKTNPPRGAIDIEMEKIFKWDVNDVTPNINEDDMIGYIGKSSTVSTTLPPPSTVSRQQSYYYCVYIKDKCMRAYTTGPLCARTIFFTYLTYPNYCLMDFVNCVEQLEVWNMLHMGKCYEALPLSSYRHYAYFADEFLDQEMVIDKIDQ